MAILLSIFAQDILPVFLIAGAGFLLARYFEADVRTLSHVVLNALAPCLVFHLLVTSRLNGPQLGRMVLFAVLMTGAIGLIGRLAAIPLRLDRPSLIGFLLVIMFSNGGNYGLPVTLFAFGRDALSYATVYFVTTSTLLYTVGMFMAATGRHSVGEALARLWRVPPLYGVAAAAIVMTFGLEVPLPIMRPIDLLADAALPTMILVLGMQLERASRPDHLSAVAVAAVVSLLVAPAIATLITWSIGLSGAARQAAIIESSMPAAVVTTILALEFDVTPAFVTGVVLVTTLLSPFTLTALIALLQRQG